MHDRDGQPDPDPRVPAGWFDEPPPAPRSGAVLVYGCLGLALLLAAGVAIYLAVR